MWLSEALRIQQSTCVSFVGAGGKTTALFQIARELSSLPGNSPQKTVIVTTTTHLGTWQSGMADRCVLISSKSDLDKLESEFSPGVVLLVGEEKNGFLGGLSPWILERVWKIGLDRDFSLLIEADGSRNHPLKAPAEHEPSIPGFTKMVVVSAGLSGLGKPLTTEWVQRAERFALLSRLGVGELVDEDGLLRVLTDPNGGIKNIPIGAGKIVLLNQADTDDLQSKARRLSEHLISTYDASIVASLGKKNLMDGEDGKVESPEIYAVVEKIGGIILAAGESRRLGEPKQLLRWHEQSFIRHVVRSAVKAGLKPVIVVVGAYAEEVIKEIESLQVCIVRNSEWKKGLSTTIKVGINALPKNSGGAVFLQVDQPQVPASLIRKLVDEHSKTLRPIIAPQINEQRGNPVLFDRKTLPQFSTLEGDAGGRVLFSQYPIHLVPWKDKRLLIDIDTPEDYQRFLNQYQAGVEPE